jgi:hypothetical protein
MPNFCFYHISNKYLAFYLLFCLYDEQCHDRLKIAFSIVQTVCSLSIVSDRSGSYFTFLISPLCFPLPVHYPAFFSAGGRLFIDFEKYKTGEAAHRENPRAIRMRLC